MQHKFKVVLTDGSVYKPPLGKFVVMSSQGVFFLVDMSYFYIHVTKLSDEIGAYTVVWSDN